MAKFIIRYGKKFEIQRIKFTISKLEWYKSNGYKPRLPKISNSPSEDEIKDIVNKEFSELEYKKVKKKLEKDCKIVGKIFAENIKQLINKSLPRTINVFLTRYGTGGSYYVPNRIVINISCRNLVKVLKHEIIHLLLEEEVKKRKFSQKEKEKFINKVEKKIK